MDQLEHPLTLEVVPGLRESVKELIDDLIGMCQVRLPAQSTGFSTRSTLIALGEPSCDPPVFIREEHCSQVFCVAAT